MKKLYGFILLTILFTLALAGQGWAAIYYINGGSAYTDSQSQNWGAGNDTTGTGSLAAPWATLTKAMNTSTTPAAGSIFIISGGGGVTTYDEPITGTAQIVFNPNTGTGTTYVQANTGETVNINIATDISGNYILYSTKTIIFQNINWTNTNSKAKSWVNNVSNVPYIFNGGSFDMNNTASMTGVSIGNPNASTTTFNNVYVKNGNNATTCRFVGAVSGTPTVIFNSPKLYNIRYLCSCIAAGTNLKIYNATGASLKGYTIYCFAANTVLKVKNCVMEYVTGGNNRFIYAEDAAAASFIANPSNFDVTNNILWRESIIDNTDYENLIFGSTYFLPIDKTNRFMNPGFTNYAGGDYTLTAASYAVGRGLASALPAAGDFTGTSWTGTDVGCYANPVATPIALVLDRMAGFMGDSIMLGTGATAGNACFNQFAVLSGYPTATSGCAYAGLGLQGCFWLADQVMTTVKPKKVFIAIGVNNFLAAGTTPSHLTTAQASAQVTALMQKLAGYGTIPMWLGCESATGNPPDNTTIADFNSKVVTACGTNGWRSGDILTKMMLNANWKTDYYADLTTNLHPDNDGHGIIAKVACGEYLTTLGSPMFPGLGLGLGQQPPPWWGR